MSGNEVKKRHEEETCGGVGWKKLWKRRGKDAWKKWVEGLVVQTCGQDV